MKKTFFAIILFLCSMFVVADDLVIRDMLFALEKSNELLKQADSTIERLEAEKAELYIYINKLLEELEKNTKILEKANDRIEKDQKEIESLRSSIATLIESGVEIKSYTWGIGVYATWPIGAGVHIEYNLPWITNLGIITGFDFNIEQQFPSVHAGIKINLD